MAILDMQNMLSYKQAVTVSAVSANIIDLGPNMWSKSSGNDTPIPLELFVEETFAAAGAATLQMSLNITTADAVQPNGVVVPGTVLAPQRVDLPVTVDPPVGSSLAAVSPAVVVPSMLAVKEAGGPETVV